MMRSNSNRTWARYRSSAENILPLLERDNAYHNDEGLV
jgi:hypothetical protein